jgi:hypothetical protein
MMGDPSRKEAQAIRDDVEGFNDAQTKSIRLRLREYLSPGGLKPGEKKLVQKIDFFILTFCCLSYFLNYVSSSVILNQSLENIVFEDILMLRSWIDRT